MTTRILPPDEWPKLSGTLLETVWPHLDPAQVRIWVVEDGDRVVGCAALLQAWHLEGFWADPSRPRVAVNRRLVRAVRADLADLAIDEVLVMATDPKYAALCRGFGDPRPLDCAHLSVKVGA